MIPEGWLISTLENLIDIKHGFAFKSDYFRSEGEYILTTPGHFFEVGGFRDQGNKTKYYVGEVPKGYILNKGDVLLAMTEQAAGLLGSAMYVPHSNKYLHNQRLGLVIVLDHERVCKEYIYLIYNSSTTRKIIAEQASGTKVKHTSPSKLLGVNVLIPPLSEQKKIAKIISAWDKAISITETILTNSLQQRKSLMQQLITGRRRFPEFFGEWFFVDFNDFFKVVNNKASQVKSSDYKADGSIPIIDQGKDFISGYCNNTNIYKEVPVIVFGDHTRCLKWVDFEFCPGADGTQLLTTKSIFDKKYGYYILCNTEIPNLGYSRHMRELKEKEFKVSGDIAEKRKITAVLSIADLEIETIKQKIHYLKQEKKALMQQLLTGKRRVKVDAA